MSLARRFHWSWSILHEFVANYWQESEKEVMPATMCCYLTSIQHSFQNNVFQIPKWRSCQRRLRDLRWKFCSTTEPWSTGQMSQFSRNWRCVHAFFFSATQQARRYFSRNTSSFHCCSSDRTQASRALSVALDSDFIRNISWYKMFEGERSSGISWWTCETTKGGWKDSKLKPKEITIFHKNVIVKSRNSDKREVSVSCFAAIAK